MRTLAAIALIAISAAADPQRETRTEERLTFEAASIKPAAGAANPLPVAPAAPNRLRIASMTLTQLIYTA
jgi:hypothetical protein